MFYGIKEGPLIDFKDLQAQLLAFSLKCAFLGEMFINVHQESG